MCILVTNDCICSDLKSVKIVSLELITIFNVLSILEARSFVMILSLKDISYLDYPWPQLISVKKHAVNLGFI